MVMYRPISSATAHRQTVFTFRPAVAKAGPYRPYTPLRPAAFASKPPPAAEPEEPPVAEIEEDLGQDVLEDPPVEEFVEDLPDGEDLSQEFTEALEEEPVEEIVEEVEEIPEEEEEVQVEEPEVPDVHPEDAAEEQIPGREDDLNLEDVAEDMREAVQGSMQLRRMLSGDESRSEEPAAKKRKLTDALPDLEPEKAQLLGRWNMAAERAVRYVMQAASMDEVRKVATSGWRPQWAPRADGTQKTAAEQLNEKILKFREESAYGTSGGSQVDVVTAFARRWDLPPADTAVLRKLTHKDLRHVMKEFDGTSSVSQLAEEASLLAPAEEAEKTEDAAAEKPGLLTCSRFNRLELISPVDDALVVGDANLSFARLLAQHREALGHVGRIVATTFETIEILRERYPEIDATVKELEDKNAEVLHNVDGTRLAVDPRFQGMENTFGAVYYNFPHAGVVRGFFDGHPFVRWRHENLMHLFFRALRGFVKPGGVVKVASNANATGVRFSDILTGAQNSEFLHVETMPFLEWSLRSYRRSYGDRRDAERRPDQHENYRSQCKSSDMVYTFRYEPTGGTPPKPQIRRPPTKDDLFNSQEGKMPVGSVQKKKKAEEIYELFLTYVQGIHVG
mmetsp:Transcript_58831/g.137809  ORF Transcript_58831/g.137809 Transcript_58831/m.137809 type:complete len:620 (+) Transcript_58831:43-1902(+)